MLVVAHKTGPRRRAIQTSIIYDPPFSGARRAHYGEKLGEIACAKCVYATVSFLFFSHPGSRTYTISSPPCSSPLSVGHTVATYSRAIRRGPKGTLLSFCIRFERLLHAGSPPSWEVVPSLTPKTYICCVRFNTLRETRSLSSSSCHISKPRRASVSFPYLSCFAFCVLSSFFLVYRRPVAGDSSRLHSALPISPPA